MGREGERERGEEGEEGKEGWVEGERKRDGRKKRVPLSVVFFCWWFYGVVDSVQGYGCGAHVYVNHTQKKGRTNIYSTKK